MLAHPAGQECATNARLHNCTKTTLAASHAKNAGPSTSNTVANKKTPINTRQNIDAQLFATSATSTI